MDLTAMQQGQNPVPTTPYPAQLTFSISALSVSSLPNHAGKPLWTHVHCDGQAFVTFEAANGRGLDRGIGIRQLFKIVAGGSVYEEIYLDHLARLAEIDAKNGVAGKESGSKLNIVVRKPLLAIKYTSENFESRRFQIKINTSPVDGFDSVLERLRLYGLVPREAGKSPNAHLEPAQQARPARINVPTFGAPVAPMIPLASSQTQGQRVDPLNYNSQDQSQPQSIPLPSSGLQSQKSAPFYVGPALGEPLSFLTNRPVQRKLSFATPPSSGEMRDVTFAQPGPGHGIVDVHLPPNSSMAGRNFAPQTSPLRNDITSSIMSDPFLDLPGFGASSIDAGPLSEPWRPATAPLTSCNTQNVEDVVAPPKRKLPFASDKKGKKAANSNSQSSDTQSGPGETAIAKPENDAMQTRPSTSPADLGKSTRANSARPKAKKPAKPKNTATARKPTIKKPKLNDKIHTFIEDEETLTRSREDNGKAASQQAAKSHSINDQLSYRSVATQAALLSFNIPASRDQGSQSNAMSDTDSSRALCDLLKNIDTALLNTKGAEDRETMLEDKVLSLLREDRLIDLCEELEQACKNVGIVV